MGRVSLWLEGSGILGHYLQTLVWDQGAPWPFYNAGIILAVSRAPPEALLSKGREEEEGAFPLPGPPPLPAPVGPRTSVPSDKGAWAEALGPFHVETGDWLITHE